MARVVEVEAVLANHVNDQASPRDIVVPLNLDQSQKFLESFISGEPVRVRFIRYQKNDTKAGSRDGLEPVS